MLGSGTWVPLLRFFFFLLSKYYKALYSELVLCPEWPSLSVPEPMISPIFDDGGHSFTWLSALVNVPDCRITAITGTCQQWVISAEQWLLDGGFASRVRRKDEQLCSGCDPCWQPIWIIQIETTSFASLTGLGLDLVRSLFNFLCLWEGSTCVCWLGEGLGVIITASVNLTFKFHSGLEAPGPKILKQQYLPIFQISGNSDCICFLIC